MKFIITPPPGGGVYKSVWEEYQVVKKGREYHGCREEYNVEKRESGSIIIFPIISKKTIGKNGKNIKYIKRGRGVGIHFPIYGYLTVRLQKVKKYFNLHKLSNRILILHLWAKYTELTLIFHCNKNKYDVVKFAILKENPHFFLLQIIGW